jgi:hypothetical protein
MVVDVLAPFPLEGILKLLPILEFWAVASTLLWDYVEK